MSSGEWQPFCLGLQVLSEIFIMFLLIENTYFYLHYFFSDNSFRFLINHILLTSLRVQEAGCD